VVSELESLLSTLRPEIETQLEPHLHGFFGRVVRGYLPQVWAFKTEVESVSLTVSAAGSVRVTSGIARDYDVRITWGQKQLVSALRTRDRSRVPHGDAPIFDFRSRRGKRAFSFLRARLGL
jgi:hypothetical protein